MSLLRKYLEDLSTKTFLSLTDNQLDILDGIIPSNRLKPAPIKIGPNIVAMSPAGKYPIQRLIEVFGISGYIVDFTIESKQIIVKQKDVSVDQTQCVCVMEFYAPAYGIYRKVTGGSSHKDAGDAAKGSITDCYTSLLAELSKGFRSVWYNQYDEEGNYHPEGVNGSNSTKPNAEKKASL
jgi:hypothetical protein